MGLVDLVNHHDDENEDVTLVLPSNKNTKLIKKIQSCGLPMQRKSGGKFWVVKNAKVEKIDKDRVQGLSGRLKMHVKNKNNNNNNIISFMVDLHQFRNPKDKNKNHHLKVEIWKSMPNKARQVTEFLLYNLSKMRNDAWQKKELKRNAIVSFLLKESKGDREMTFTIINAYSRLRITVAELKLKQTKHQLDRMKQKWVQRKPSYYDQKPAKRTRITTGRENKNNTKLDQGESSVLSNVHKTVDNTQQHSNA